MVTKNVAILGSTGSIGCNTLRVIETLTTPTVRVVALGAGHNVKRLADQVATYLPEVVSVETETAAHELRELLFARDVDLPRIVIGEEGLVEVATHRDTDCVVSATVGAVREACCAGKQGNARDGWRVDDASGTKIGR